MSLSDEKITNLVANLDLLSHDNSATTSCKKAPFCTTDELVGDQMLLECTGSVELVHYGGTIILSTFEGREIHSYILVQDLPSGTI